MADWDIDTHTVSCAACSTPFEQGEQIVSSIAEKDNGFERNDYCTQCWQQLATEDPFYFWKSVFSPEKKNRVFIDDETLMDFFLRLVEEDSEDKQAFRYVLSLVLIRKKTLTFTDVCKEGDREYLMMRDREGREYRVRDPHLSREMLEDVKQQMNGILHQDFFAD